MQKGIHPGFETQGRGHQKSKEGVSVAQRKIFLKKADASSLDLGPVDFDAVRIFLYMYVWSFFSDLLTIWKP